MRCAPTLPNLPSSAAVVPCGITPQCDVGPYTSAVDDRRLKLARVKGIRRAVCRGNGDSFGCAAELKNGLDYGLPYPVDRYFACLAVTARLRTIRWKMTYFLGADGRGALALPSTPPRVVGPPHPERPRLAKPKALR